MSDAEPPSWGADPLSSFFQEAEYNSRVTAGNCPEAFELLKRVDAAFLSAEGAVEVDSDSARLIPRFLLVRAHASFRAALRVGMSGQMAEVSVLLRSAIEQSWYALHMAKGSSKEASCVIWLNRNENNQSKARCKSEFTIKNVKATHEMLAPSEASELHRIYEMLIDLGAHPNQRGVLGGVEICESAGRKGDFKIGMLYPDMLPMMATLRLAIAVAIGALKIFRLIYPERFAFMRLDDEIEALVRGLNSKCKK